jgi:hypothetical protein
LKYGGADSDTCHNYTPFYHQLLGDKRENIQRVLEIGINAGSSLRMWEEYFPRASIYGIDIRPETLINEGRIHSFLADAGNGASIENALWQMGNPKFDLIVDDGSHELHHQVFSCNALMPSLREDGLYIIEDMCLDCQPEVVGNKLDLDHYKWEAVDCGHGIGKAHCDWQCPKCHGHEGERLLVVRHR